MKTCGGVKMPVSFNRLVERIKQYDANCNIDMLKKAYRLSRKAHDGQQRVSGEPFIIHPIEVACILAELELDCTSIIAALLHDTVEDTEYTLNQMKTDFSKEVADLVDGVTKLSKIPYNTKEEQQVENLRKMFLAMANDIRVIMIKLADRLHNMRTLKYLSHEKQLSISKETLEVYAPIAHRLGMSKIKWELEDTSLRYIDPDGYYDLVEKIAQKRKEREAFINKIVDTLKSKTQELSINAYVEGRPKHFYSIYRKMREQNSTIDQIYDLFAVRLIVDTVKDCYAVLGMVHELYKPIPGRFKDYIAMPKPNMYQSLHTAVIGNEGHPFEVQIRTWEMHKVAEVGIAAHWKYKEGNKSKGSADDKFSEKLAWVRQLLEWQKEMPDAAEFMENLKIDMFNDEVFVFTPKGDVINLPKSSTPIDFAYTIHSAIGNKMIGAKINGRLMPLEYKLNNGDIVEIITSSNAAGPSRDWLKIVKSSQAKSKIKQWFKKEKREENIVRGKELIEKELKKHGLTQSQLFRPEWVDTILKKYSFSTPDDLYAAIGYGAITANKIVSRMKEEYKKIVKAEELEQNIIDGTFQKAEKKKTTSPVNGIIVKGIDNCLVRLSRCCNPVPGDSIIGYVTRGRGVSVHTSDCINVKNNPGQEERLIEVSWNNGAKVSYKVDISILANDRDSLLIDITNAISEAKIPLKAINARTTKDRKAIMTMTLEITDTEQLNKILKRLRKIDGVFETTRNKH
jgi:guanosine-3',5'-bis(diphosphate) 3'-pyrophosphohydrolase